MKVVAILQARLGSSRLPNKVLLPLAGAPMVQRIIERVQRAKLVDEVVLAVPKEPDSHLLEAIAAQTKCIYARFDHIPANDLVARYLGAAMAYRADIIVRVPCDNPVVDPAYIDDAIKEYMSRPYNFYSNTLGYVSVPKQRMNMAYSVDGVGCEVFSFSTLKWLNEITNGHESWREHPHKYWEDFVKDCDYDSQEPSIETHGNGSAVEYRLDVNTQNEYEYIKDIYDHFGHNNFTSKEVLLYLQSKVPA